jgi:hypothetical protein
MSYPSLEQRLKLVREGLHNHSNLMLLDSPLSAWILPSDRHLPQSFLGRTLREIVAYTYSDLTRLPNIGHRRIEKLIGVLERIVPPPPHQAVDPPPAPEAPTPSVVFDVPPEMTPEIWASWCAIIQRHGLEHETIGRLVDSLGTIPQTLGSTPLANYTRRTLAELRTLPNHGEARCNHIFAVFARVVQTVAQVPANAPLGLRLLPGELRTAILWAESVVRDQLIPSCEALRAQLLTPLCAQIQVDLGTETALVVQRRLGLAGPAEPLRPIAHDMGLTRERIRQITVRAAQGLRVRWPEGGLILDGMHAHFQVTPNCAEQFNLVRLALEICFEWEEPRAGLRTEVLNAWGWAAHAKRTPMSSREVAFWAATEFPGLSPNRVRRWLTEAGYRHAAASGDDLFFSNDPLDQLLLRLHTQSAPILLDALPNVDLHPGWSLRHRVERDPRFITDETKRLWPSETATIFRNAGRWQIRLNPLLSSSAQQRTKAIGLGELVHLLIGGLLQVGICDATVWGGHRFLIEALRKVHAATFPPDLTAFVLAHLLLSQSNGLIRHMRRRRLRWTSADGLIPVRGKRGWINQVVQAAAVPMTLAELDTALRGWFQDYEAFALNQVFFHEVEDGEPTYGCQFINSSSTIIPPLVVPRGWELDLATVNVSAGVRNVVAQIVNLSQQAPFPKAHLRQIPWLVRLCEHSAASRMRWSEQPFAATEPLSEWVPPFRIPAPPPDAEDEALGRLS